MFLSYIKEKPEEVPGVRFGEKVVYFVRHGQSHANLVEWKDKHNDNLRDAGLTEIGKDQARALQAVVGQWRSQVVVCSPLTRTIQTACLAFEEQPLTPIISWPEVSEYYGQLPECKGRPLSQLRKDEQLLELKRFKDVSLEYIDAEDDVEWWCRADDRGRLGRFLSWLSNCPETRIAVVTHWGFIRLLMDYVDCTEDLLLENCTFVCTKWQRRTAQLKADLTPTLTRVSLKKPLRSYGIVLVPAREKEESQREAAVSPLLTELVAFRKECSQDEVLGRAKSSRGGGALHCTIAGTVPFYRADDVVAVQDLLARVTAEMVMQRREDGHDIWHADQAGDSVRTEGETLHLRSAGKNVTLFYGLFFESQYLTSIVRLLSRLPCYEEAPHALRHCMYHATVVEDSTPGSGQLGADSFARILAKYPLVERLLKKGLDDELRQAFQAIEWQLAIISPTVTDPSIIEEVGRRFRL